MEGTSRRVSRDSCSVGTCILYLRRDGHALMRIGGRTTKLSMHAMGAAIPLALSLALAIRDALPGGAPTSEGVAGTVKMQVTTGTQIVSDEVTPDDEVRPCSLISFL
jgi:hypothetical protein